jgi:hypothetical protein
MHFVDLININNSVILSFIHSFTVLLIYVRNLSTKCFMRTRNARAYGHRQVVWRGYRCSCEPVAAGTDGEEFA